MRIVVLAIIALCGYATGSRAQTPPDPTRLSESQIRIISENRTDTLGFKLLSSKTSLKPYRGNGQVVRTLRSIRNSADGTIIWDAIAGTPIAALLKVEYRSDCTYILRNPLYGLASGGIVLIGERDFMAPWNDVLTDWTTIDCYFIPYASVCCHPPKTELLRTVRVNHRRSMPVGEISFRVQQYDFPGIVPGDTLTNRTLPLIKGMENVDEYLSKQICYPVLALENDIDGHTVAAFTVNPDRSITGIRIVRANDPACDREVMRVIRLTDGKWLPGTVDGKEVPVEILVTAVFRLSE